MIEEKIIIDDKSNELKHTDERVTLLRRKIQSDAYQIFIVLLLASVVIQQFFFKAPNSQFIIEFACVVVSTFYILIKNILAGNNLYSFKNFKKSMIINSLIIGFFCVFFMVIFAGISEIFTLAIVYTCTILSYGILTLIAYTVTQRKQKKIEEQLDPDE